MDPRFQSESTKNVTHAILGKIHNLPQEYWSPRIIFSIVGGIGTQIALDDATDSRSFGHFAKVLVEINLKNKLPGQILVEREDFAFFVSIEYEKSTCFLSWMSNH
ncbi:hypothetical protein Lalb_Chr23g0276971 [Lupinus albus]|uniref:DUF4283 domain-containing protein n=1 Tax=Lupinus albus TaxID=3870 RepID=A0A6A4NG18_LUPAL|nr:hypothetical protein Lalb_Chr23g0276971 [Lupinus albus]